VIRFGLALVAALLLFAGGLAAEPYIAVRDGYKCSKCHVNRTGGGKRTEYAQAYMQTRMTAGPVMPAPDQERPEREFFSGMLNDYFSVGLDVRTTYTLTNPSAGTDEHEFNRPDQCGFCHASEGGGKLGEMYFHAEPLPDRVSVVASFNLLPTVSEREVYALIEDLWANGYLKAGQFRLPTGLQNTYDDPFAHGHGRGTLGVLGTTTEGVVGVESVRGSGVEFGFEPGVFSFIFSVTNPESKSSLPRDDTYNVMIYAVGGAGLLGLNYADDPSTATLTRETTSLFGGFALGRFTFMLQMDTIKEEDEAAATEAEAETGLAEVDYLIARGHNLKLQYEFIDPDKDTEGDVVDRLSVIYEPFVRPYLQWRVGYRDYTGPEGDTPSNKISYFGEIHVLF
jgi:hypothetical protein